MLICFAVPDNNSHLHVLYAPDIFCDCMSMATIGPFGPILKLDVS